MTYLSHPDSLEFLTRTIDAEPGTTPFQLPPHPLFQISFATPTFLTTSSCVGCSTFKHIQVLELVPPIDWEPIPITAVLVQCKSAGRDIHNSNAYDDASQMVRLITKPDALNAQLIAQTTQGLRFRYTTFFREKELDQFMTVEDFFLPTSQYSLSRGIARIKSNEIETPASIESIASTFMQYTQVTSNELIYPSPRGFIHVHQRVPMVVDSYLASNYDLDFVFNNFQLLLSDTIGLGKGHFENSNFPLSRLIDTISNVDIKITPRLSYAWTRERMNSPVDDGSLLSEVMDNIAVELFVQDLDDASGSYSISSWSVQGVIHADLLSNVSLERHLFYSESEIPGMLQHLELSINISDQRELLQTALSQMNFSHLHLKDLWTSRKTIAMKISLPEIQYHGIRSTLYNILFNPLPILSKFSVILGSYNIEVNSAVENDVFTSSSSYKKMNQRDLWAVTSCDIDFIPPFLSKFIQGQKWKDPAGFPQGTSKEFISLYNSASIEANLKLWCSPPEKPGLPSVDLFHTGDGTVETSGADVEWEWNLWDTRFGNLLPPTMYITSNSGSSSYFDLHVILQPPFYLKGFNVFVGDFVQIEFSVPKDVIVPGKAISCQWGLFIENDASATDRDWQETESSYIYHESSGEKKIISRVYNNQSITRRFFPNIALETLMSILSEAEQSEIIDQFLVPPKMEIKCGLFALNADETGSLFPRPEYLPIQLSSFGNIIAKSQKMLFEGFRNLSPSPLSSLSPQSLSTSQAQVQTQVQAQVQDALVMVKSWFIFNSTVNGMLTSLEMHFEQNKVDLMVHDLFEVYLPSAIAIKIGHNKYLAPTCEVRSLSLHGSDNKSMSFPRLQTITTMDSLNDAIVLSFHFSHQEIENTPDQTTYSNFVRSGIIPQGSEIVVVCHGFVSQPTPPKVELVSLTPNLGHINYSIKRPLGQGHSKPLGYGQLMKPSPSLQQNPFGEMLSTMSVGYNDIRPNGTLTFFNATIAPFRMTSLPNDVVDLGNMDEITKHQATTPGFVEGNVLMAVLPSGWILNHLPPDRVSCFFKMFHFGKLGPYNLLSPHDLNSFKMPYAPKSTRYVIKSFGSGPNQFHVVAMEIGPLKSDNAVKLAQYTKYPHFIDDTPLQDTSYNVDALSMHCMSDFPIPISRKAGSPMMTAGPMASFLPLAFIKSTSVAKKLQGNFLLFPSWLHLEKAFEQYSIQGNTVYTNTIHSLSKYHRSHVEAAPANYIQQNSQGWKQRSLLRQNIRLLSDIPLTKSQLQFLQEIWGRRLKLHDVTFTTPISTEPTLMSTIFDLSTKIFKQELETFHFYPSISTIIYPTLSSNEEFFQSSLQTQTPVHIFETKETIVVSFSFDAVTFGVSEQQVKDLIVQLLADSTQEIVNVLGVPMIVGLDAGSLILPEYCYDGIHGFSHDDTAQNETDLDCGGKRCSQCGLERRCLWDSDCFSLHCDKNTHTCAVPSTNYLNDRKEQLAWNESGQPFNIFDKSPFVNPLDSLLKTLDPDNQWLIGP